MLDALGVLICRLFHDAASWPAGNYYRCLKCGRKYRVPWARVTEPGVYEQVSGGMK